ncbi:MAG TPA: hemin uptake protein HemP [Alicycliphilus sp.]|nr:hemin uptake protein HemP [Alicycliphilus sp.]HRP19836.1 hemin uptake protein HemP [Alicycliphilus sp.]
MQLSLTAHTRAPRSRLFAHGDVGRSEVSEHLPAAVTALDSNNLLRGRKAVTIVHNGASYRLQATKLGKLILTK